MINNARWEVIAEHQVFKFETLEEARQWLGDHGYRPVVESGVWTRDVDDHMAWIQHATHHAKGASHV